MSIDEAVFRIYEWQYRPSTTFYCKLLDLISSSDVDNFNAFKSGFPALIHAFELWKEVGDDLFRHYNLKVGGEDAGISTKQ